VNAGRFRDGPTISVASCCAVYRSILQCVAEVHQSAAEAAFVGYCYLFFPQSVCVEHAKHEPCDLVIDA
jgi:hypothetical protein